MLYRRNCGFGQYGVKHSAAEGTEYMLRVEAVPRMGLMKLRNVDFRGKFVGKTRGKMFSAGAFFA